MKLIHLIIAVASSFTGMSLFAESYIHEPDLKIEWKTTNSFPKKVWTYEIVPTVFSPETISYLQSVGGFTDKDKEDMGTNGVAFTHGRNNLRISFSEGEISYYSVEKNYTENNLATNVPSATNILIGLATNTLSKLGIRLSELSKDASRQPAFYFTDMEQLFHIKNSHTFVTNIPYRVVNFRRSLDGVIFNYFGGYGRILYGENGKIVGMDVEWRKVKRDKLCTVPDKEKMADWIRNGKVETGIVWDAAGKPIDWSSVDKVIIDYAQMRYYGELFLGARLNRPIFPSYITPMIELGLRIECRGHEYKIGVQCPVNDE